jgi:hypothetical protein
MKPAVKWYPSSHNLVFKCQCFLQVILMNTTSQFFLKCAFPNVGETLLPRYYDISPTPLYRQCLSIREPCHEPEISCPHGHSVAVVVGGGGCLMM